MLGVLRGFGRRFMPPATVALGAGTAGLLSCSASSLLDSASPSSGSAPCQPWEHPNGAGQLPVHSLEDVAKHNSLDTGVWVTFRGCVYDITSFLENHPGGVDKIMSAAGQSVEPFWELYRQHLQGTGHADGGPVPKEHVAEILAPLQIGWLDADSMAKMPDRSPDDPYANEPTRHPALKLLSETPCSGESPAHLMGDSWTTPNALFFVRNHHPVPVMDGAAFELEVSGPGQSSPKMLTLNDLRNLPKTTITATLQCGGNRRGELNSVRKTSGNAWGIGAISNATWTGVRLRDVLEVAGIPNDEKRALAAGVEHIQLEGEVRLFYCVW